MDYIKIDSDSWDDHNIVYKVIQYATSPTSSAAVNLVLENTSTNETYNRTVAYHQIEWLKAKDW